MKKTLVLSLALGATVGFSFTGCTKYDQPGDDTTSTDTADTNDTNDTNDDVGETGDTSGDTSGDDSGDTLTTNAFVPDEDFATISECDPFQQDCPMGEKCVPYGSTGGNWDANKCVAVTGSGAAGDSCTYGGVAEATDDCDALTHCWDVMDVDGVNLGVCTEFCMGTADDPSCPGDTSCLIANDGSINMCIASCDPILQPCEQGLGCFWSGNEFQCIFTSSDIPTGDTCGFINDCEPGNFCANADLMPDCQGSSCCASFCDLTDPVCPQMGTECAAFFEEGTAPPQYIDVGACLLPG